MKNRFTQCTLKDIASNEKKSIISGPFGSNISSKFFQESGVPVIRGNNLSNSCVKFIDNGFAYLSEEKADELNAYAIKDDLLFTAAGTIGQVGIIEENTKFEKYVISNKQLRVRLNIEKINPLYAYYWFSSPWMVKDIVNKNTGSTVPLINLGIIKTLEIKIPKERITQDKIVSVLSALDSKIELNNRINTELEAMAKTLYDYWFVQFDFPDKDGKPYKTSGGKMLWNEDLKRDIPDGWNVDILKNHISIERGISYKGTDIQDKGIPMVNLNSFYLDGRYKDEGIKYFAGSVNENKVIHAGDLMIATTDVTRNAYIIGKSFILPDLYAGQIVASCDIAKVNIGDKLDKYFIDMLFNSDNYHRYIKGFASGTLVLHLDTKGVDWYKCLIPPKDLLNKYANFKVNIDGKKTLTLKENKQLAELRDWLLPMLMNGQVQVAPSH